MRTLLATLTFVLLGLSGLMAQNTQNTGYTESILTQVGIPWTYVDTFDAGGATQGKPLYHSCAAFKPQQSLKFLDYGAFYRPLSGGAWSLAPGSGPGVEQANGLTIFVKTVTGKGGPKYAQVSRDGVYFRITSTDGYYYDFYANTYVGQPDYRNPPQLPDNQQVVVFYYNMPLGTP